MNRILKRVIALGLAVGLLTAGAEPIFAHAQNLGNDNGAGSGNVGTDIGNGSENGGSAGSGTENGGNTGGSENGGNTGDTGNGGNTGDTGNGGNTGDTGNGSGSIGNTSGKEIVVVLDPGHGGTDSGAVRNINGGIYYERDIVLKIANYCKEELEKVGGYTVYMTRTDNISPLWNREQRAELARQVNADALISFHINATGEDITTAVTGSLVYRPNDNYNYTIAKAGLSLANSILTQLVGLGLADNGVIIRNAQEDKYPDGSAADYLGINYWSKMKGFPGVLIEHAFINNPNDVANYLTTEEQLKSLGIADARGIVQYFNSPDAFFNEVTGEWRQNQTGWWYAYYKGGYAANKWEQIGGKWYWFNAAGYMTEGWQYINNKWYYLTPGSGAMAEGWQYLNGTWYYLIPGSGAMAEGWQLADGTWYYLTPGSGAMVTGWQQINGTWYYLNGSGAMVTGWLYLNGTWYYMTESGAMAEGWQLVNGTWFFLTPGSGAMATGWRLINGSWYYLHDNGAMAVGWIRLNGTWYYMTESGAMATGWIQSGGSWYYLYDSGAMAENTWIGSYYVNGSGVWVN